MSFKKRSITRMINVTFIVVMVLLMVVGCSKNSSTTVKTPQVPKTEIKEKVITDMAGREIILSEKIEKVFSLTPNGTIMLYTLCPEKLIGWNYELSEMERYYILPECKDLPNLGGVGNNPLNAEEILKLKPDVIIHVTEINETNISAAEQLQNELNIPVVILDQALEKTPDTYIMLGEIVGNKGNSATMSSYAKETLEQIQYKAGLISEGEKVKVYYAEGKDGLETDPRGSKNVRIIDEVAGINVAEVAKMGGSGRLTVSLEQLLIWNPDLIIAWADDRGGYYSKIFEDKSWKSINAVKNNEVYEIPNFPFSWFDRPASVNRILGLKWLGNLLYPEVFDYDIEEEVKFFYEQFYHYKLTEDELTKLLETSTKR